MNGSRWTVLVLVVAAFGASLAYGLKDTGRSTNTEDLKPLQAQAALDPCPSGLGAGFPDLTLRCLGGGPDVRLRASAPSVPTLVNVYGSWCGPCLKEMPLLREVYDKRGDRLALVGVDTQEQYPRLGLQFAIDVRQHWPALVDDDRSVGAHFRPGVPLMVFVRADGTVAHVESGGYTSLATLEGDIRTHLGVAL